MAYTTINNGKLYFEPITFTASNNSSNTVSGMGFQPDLIWWKNREQTYPHFLYDVIRGNTKQLASNTTGAEETRDSTYLTSFNSNGFTTGTALAGDTSDGIASWNWKANGTGSANTAGSINSTVSASATSGFSIVKYTGTGTNSDTVGHGLGTTPSMIIAKGLDSREWYVQHQAISSGTLNLESTGAATTNFSSGWINESPTNSVFSFTVGSGGTTNNVNNSGTDFIAYCFKDVQGYSKFSSYVGNGNADGTFVYTGFKPAFVMIKRATGGTGNWQLFDNKRLGYNVNNYGVQPNLNSAENTANDLDLLSNGFKNRQSGNDLNGSNTYIYMAFAENPFTSSAGTPVTAR